MKFEEIAKRIDENNGYISMNDLKELNISKQYFYMNINKLSLIKVNSGLYAKDDIIIDNLYVRSFNNNFIYSYESSLFLNKFTLKELEFDSITVINGYNAKHLKKYNFSINYVDESIFDLGKAKVLTPFGNSVNCYDLERTICDIICNKNKIDMQVFSYALKQYFSLKNRNLNKLIKYAKKLKCLDKVRNYAEILI